MDETDILPCPFCGEPPVVERTTGYLDGWTIRCEAPECMGPHTTAACIEDAALQWNHRAIVSPSAEAKHKLVDGALKREDSGIVARCQCGWSSRHFSSLSASAAFMDHQDICAAAARVGSQS